MDGHQFDDLLRSFSHSRRAAITTLLAAAGGWESLAIVEARKKRKQKRKKRKGGSCGDCFGGTCAAGTCTCAAGYEVCRGACLIACPPALRRNPDTCGCCIGSPSVLPCVSGEQCCSGDCTGGVCQGRNGQETCTFNEQCASMECQSGVCTCTGNVCSGICRPACSPDRTTRNPVTCACCVKNGLESLCGGNSCACCCSGFCGGPVRVCVGRQFGMDCEFNAQCASGNCKLVPVGGDFSAYRCV